MINSLDFLSEKLGSRQKMNSIDRIKFVFFKNGFNKKVVILSFLKKHMFFFLYLLALTTYLLVRLFSNF